MPQKTATNLLNKYRKGKCSPQEKALIENYIIFDGITENQLTDDQINSHLDDLEVRIAKIPVKIKLWPYIAAAAVIVISIATGILFYTFQGQGLTVRELNAKTNIPPGKNIATLMLASGKVINLIDTKTGVIIKESTLSYDDGTKIGGNNSEAVSAIQNSKTNLLLTASTPKGGTYKVTLPDGTAVWLNAASKLKFPIKFSGKYRKIFFEGEAYFEVFKDPEHPFIVETPNQQVQVLGTHFNVNAYADELESKITLVEGAVKTAGVILKPGEQAIQTPSGTKVVKVNTNIAIAWKNGEFMFSNERLESIMKKISRWYNVEIIYQTPALKNELFGGTISKFGNVSEVLQMLELTGTVHFKIEGRRITIMK
jgi:transmembrane sensor